MRYLLTLSLGLSFCIWSAAETRADETMSSAAERSLSSDKSTKPEVDSSTAKAEPPTVLVPAKHCAKGTKRCGTACVPSKDKCDH